MRVFNRIVVLLLLAGLFLFSLFGALYCFGLFGYRLSSLSGYVEAAAGGAQSFVGGVEGGSLTALGVAVLIVAAVAGVVLLVLELKPRTPRRVRMKKGTYISRGAVRKEVEAAAGDNPAVLESSAKVGAKRKSGAKVRVNGSAARGQDVKTVSKQADDRIRERLGRSGIPIGSMKVSLSEADPRQTETRVR